MQDVDINNLLFLIAAILLTAVLIYLAARIIIGRKDSDTGYFINLLLSAVLIWVIILVVGTIVGTLGTDLSSITGLSQAITVIVFTGSIYVIKILIVSGGRGGYDSWERSIWITLLTFIFIYAVNYITGSLGQELIYFF